MDNPHQKTTLPYCREVFSRSLMTIRIFSTGINERTYTHTKSPISDMSLTVHKTVRTLSGSLVFLLAGQGIAFSAQETDLIQNPDPAHFNICFNHGCQGLADVRLTPEQWGKIRQLFAPKSVSPQQERERIAQAVGKLETLVGRLTGIDNDRGGSLAGLWLRNQMDCVDESTNTHHYLVMLYNDGLLKYHEPVDIARRFRPYLYQHYSAVIKETVTQKLYAVDSWFLDNGKPPIILPLSLWKQGWTTGDEIPNEKKKSRAKNAGFP
ncbi:MAG TPA: hypothetical protein VFU39_02070 [Sulfuricaulis sp.]|nr:hypothetical protein [Sulfuricaulis sp.]